MCILCNIKVEIYIIVQMSIELTIFMEKFTPLKKYIGLHFIGH